MACKPWMAHGRIQHRLLPVHEYIVDPGIDHSLPIEGLEVAQETGGKVAVAGAEFDDSQRRLRLRRPGVSLLPGGNFLEIIRGKGMGKPIVGGGKGLVKPADLIAPKTIKELINMRLPLIDGLIVPDQLGKRIRIL